MVNHNGMELEKSSGDRRAPHCAERRGLIGLASEVGAGENPAIPLEEKRNEMKSPYPEIVKTIAKEFLATLEKYYPGLSEKTVDSHGFPVKEKGCYAIGRIEACVYIELLKAGILSEPFKPE